MMVSLKIDDSTCIRCLRCVKVCPSSIFYKNNAENRIETQNIEYCIRCGHCVAVCPTDSVKHGDFPEDKVHMIDRDLLPSPEQVMLLIKSRRSNRVFTKNPVPEDKLDMIVEAAHRAPTASNMQNVEFTLVTDPRKLHAVSSATIEIFSALAKRLNNPFIKPVAKRIVPEVYGYLPRFGKLIEEFKNGNDLILRNATALLFIHAPKESRFGSDDCNLAYQNGSLMAESLGVSQFYTGFVCTAIRQDKDHRIEKMLGINGRIHAGMALGLTEFKYPNYIDKKDTVLKKF
ncbi:MAG: nitroreductase family protein [Rikenellaceae bacterium]|nr:nitroreductase family protein [Rikenellaceae bacterium]